MALVNTVYLIYVLNYNCGPDSIKDALKREQKKNYRGIWNAHNLKDLDKTFHELNMLAESVVKGNFCGLREGPKRMQDRRVMCAQRPQLFAVLVKK